MESPFVNASGNRRSSRNVFIYTALAIAAIVGCYCGMVAFNSVQLRAQENDATRQAWNQWKVNYGRSFGGAEETFRYNIFSENYKFINEHNTKQNKYSLGLNQFADLSSKEFAMLYTGAVPNVNSKNCPEPVDSLLLEDAPLAATLDWRAKGIVGPVKNQQHCGSCWAFSTVATLESLYAQQTGKNISFSEQQLVDCSLPEGNQGCNGGWVQDAYHYVLNNGISLEGDYPYLAVDGTCNKSANIAFNVSDCGNVPIRNVNALKTALQGGPVAVYLQADHPSFHFYTGGVLDNIECFNETQIDHAVVAVGYTEDAWIVRNSWGPQWGENGYIRISTETKNSTDGVCGILSNPNTFPRSA